MAVFVNVQSIINVARISQYLTQADISRSLNRGGGNPNTNYSKLLYLVRRSVESAYELDPNDETLNDTASYLYSLCGRYINQAVTIADSEACSVPIILTQPLTQAAEDGDNVTLFVVGYSLATITYQWYLDGVALVGETDNTLALVSIDSGDYGDYTVRLTTSCGTVLSNTAVLSNDTPVVTPLIYFGTNETGVTPIEAAILAGDSNSENPLLDVAVNYGTQSETPVYYWIAIPDTGAAAEKNYWYESTLNQGSMGGLSDLFGASATVSVSGQDYFVWITQYATQFTEDDYTYSQE